ncbi:hypothetical protein BC834DRAFT_887066 [Gloeopeniophorella convolvens]|nr:hypothetical protein BC834DRAFT_887066 [Gloeopeniophorella convolvens]
MGDSNPPETVASPEGPTDFGSPFDYPDADVVLRSVDQVDFRVYKLYLVTASPVLKRMLEERTDGFNATAPHSTSSTDHTTVLPLSEDKAVLSALLTLAFPVPSFVPRTYEELVSVMVAAHKYKLQAAVSTLRLILSEHASALIKPDDAFRLFCFARQKGLVGESVPALQMTLDTCKSIDAIGKKLRFATGSCLHETWKYQELVEQEVNAAIVRSRANGEISTAWNNCSHLWFDLCLRTMVMERPILDHGQFHRTLLDHVTARGCHACRGMISQGIPASLALMERIKRGAVARSTARWLQFIQQSNFSPPVSRTYHSDFGDPFHRSDADIILRSSDSSDFRVHQAVLAISSTVFADMFALSKHHSSAETGPDEARDGLPVIYVTENSAILNILLTMVYPLPTSIPKSYEDVLSVLAAAQKYQMDSTLVLIRNLVRSGYLPGIPSNDVFTAYALAYRHRLADEVKSAALLSIGSTMTFQRLSSSLHAFDGPSLLSLSEFHTRCHESLITCLASAIKLTSPSAITFLTRPSVASRFSFGASFPVTPGQSGSKCRDLDPEFPKDTRSIPSWWIKALRESAENLRALSGCPSIQSLKICASLDSARAAHNKESSCGNWQCSGETALTCGELFCKNLESEMKGALNKVELDIPR